MSQQENPFGKHAQVHCGLLKNPLSVSKDQMRQGQACGNLLSNVLLTVAIRGAAFT
jgi:hypothetical protein